MRHGIVMPRLASWKAISSAMGPSPSLVKISQISFRMLLTLSIPSKTIFVGSSQELLWAAMIRSACGGPSGRRIFITSKLMLA